MNVEVEYIAGREWARFAPDAHKAVFSETLPPEYDRIDFALLAVDKEQARPVAYLTARELDKESVYLKHGGAFDPLKGTFHSLAVYLSLLNWLKEKYARITTLVENTNSVYLRLALAAGFTIIGIRNFKGSILVELFLEGVK